MIAYSPYRFPHQYLLAGGRLCSFLPAERRGKTVTSIMNSPVAQFAISGRMGLYEASHNHWGESFKPESSLTSMVLEPDQKVDIRVY